MCALPDYPILIRGLYRVPLWEGHKRGWVVAWRWVCSGQGPLVAPLVCGGYSFWYDGNSDFGLDYVPDPRTFDGFSAVRLPASSFPRHAGGAS